MADQEIPTQQLVVEHAVLTRPAVSALSDDGSLSAYAQRRNLLALLPKNTHQKNVVMDMFEI